MDAELQALRATHHKPATGGRRRGRSFSLTAAEIIEAVAAGTELDRE
jgi:hypothetical protein